MFKEIGDDKPTSPVKQSQIRGSASLRLGEKFNGSFEEIKGEASLLIKSVLVAVDGSENSDRAFDLALDFAEKFGASLTVLNVSESVVMAAAPQETGSYPSGNAAIVTKDLRAIQTEVLRKYTDHAKAIKPNLAVSSLAKAGDAAFAIVNTAKEGRFDVTVVGHRGLGKTKERFLGSISEKVAHSAPCTVIIVK